VAFTVATDVLLDVHVPPVILDVNVVVAPKKTPWFPDNTPAEVGVTETVTNLVALRLLHDEFPERVYEIVVVPALKGVTTPLEEIVATAVLELDHVPPVDVVV
jgi:hypothetical protein